MHFEKNVINMNKVFSEGSFYGKRFNKINKIVDVTKSNIMNKIKTTFSDAKETDISYLYLTSHGGPNGLLAIGTDSYIYASELRKFIDENVKGKVVIFVQSCHSGSFIQKSADFDDSYEQWALEFVSYFKDYNARSGEFATPKYSVICSAAKDEFSYGVWNGSVATKKWALGMGWNVDEEKIVEMEADADRNNKVTLNELYSYSYLGVTDSHIVAYPSDSKFVIYGKY